MLNINNRLIAILPLLILGFAWSLQPAQGQAQTTPMRTIAIAAPVGQAAQDQSLSKYLTLVEAFLSLNPEISMLERPHLASLLQEQILSQKQTGTDHSVAIQKLTSSQWMLIPSIRSVGEDKLPYVSLTTVETKTGIIFGTVVSPLTQDREDESAERVA